MEASINIHSLTATEVQERIGKGELTLVQYAQALLARYRARDEQVDAWVTIRPEQVLEEARQMDALSAEARGPLHGFVIGVKDIITTKDMATKHNSPLHDSDRPLLDASTVAILRRNGALIMGKTKTTEFAAATVTPGTKNPHNASRSPGGSSSGSGAAVADMQVPIGLGSQTIGSVVRPASFDGVYGFKPTWNAISTEGQKVTSLTLDTFGFMARCVSDLQKLADVFGLQDDESPQHLALGQSRFAVIKPPIWSEAGPGTIAAMDRAAQILKDSGAYVEEVKLPTDFDDVLAVQRAVLRAEAGVAFFKERDEPANYVGHEVAQLAKGIEGGSRRRRYLQAFDKLAALRPQMDEIADKYTAVLAPSSLDVAPADATWSGDPRFNAIWTALHTPVINLPGFGGEDDMPVGVSLVAPRFRDQHLLQVAATVGPLFEEKGGWKSKLH